MNEIVKYHNDFSKKIILKNFTANELNFLMAICSKVKNKNSEEVEFSFQQLKELTNWTSNDNKGFLNSLRNTNKKLLALNFEIENEEGGFIQFVLFPTFNTLPKSKVLKVAVNKQFAYLLNNLSNNFTRFELENFTTLQSKYSKLIYKELMQFKSTGYAIFQTEVFRKKLDIPEWYRFSEINKKVLAPAEKELSCIFENLIIKKIKAGREISHLEFYFSLKNEKETNKISFEDEIELFWKENFPGVNYSSKHKAKINKLKEKNNISYIKNYLQEQWNFVKNNQHIENGPAYFSQLILEEKAVYKDYEALNKK
ncbi:replication initiation protein, partial [Fusobacterium gastrosuis]|uniref:replication initiation protein n=1 Tax=Fusobacterium gastrosuis TaxID=1755100 RepID=UPI002A9FC578|nr:replication initiation protein [Fusobacterium gastrosuis]